MEPAARVPGISRQRFGTAPGGEAVELFTLGNGRGLELRVLSYGGIIVSLSIPDQTGKAASVVLGHASLEGYLGNAQPPYLGAIIGRYANRIAGASFTLDGRSYHLSANEGGNHLHGGQRGFDRVVWDAAPYAQGDETGLALSHTSPAGDQGYPGSLSVQVRYTVTGAQELSVEYQASTDHPTPVNLTQHSYFNLAGGGDVLGHLVQLRADRYLSVDPVLIPTGELAPVEGTDFDFRLPVPLGARRQGDYDHCFVVNRQAAGLVHAASIVEPGSGRSLDVYTTEPGLQLYSGARVGVCLETQHFPDSPNQAAFPSTILRPDAEYRSRTVFRFGVVA